MAKKTYKKKESLSDAVKIIVIGLLLGTVFTFGQQFWSATVTRNACTVVETTFVDYEYDRGIGRYNSESLSVDCGDGERYRFDSASIYYSLMDELDAIVPGEEITLLLHPNSDVILELATEDEVILSFEEAMEDVAGERTFFFYMGILMYGASLYGVYVVVRVLKRRKEYSQSKKGRRQL